MKHGCVPKQPAPTKDKALKLALEALEWMVANDDTNEGDEPVERLGGQSWNEYNAYWLNGLNNSRAAITAIKQAIAAPDLQAELDATNRQVEILSDALAESRREVAELKAVQEPVAVVGEDKHGPFVDWLGDRSSFYERNPVGTKFYTTPPAQEFVCSTGLCHYKPAAQRTWVGLTDDEVTICHSLAVLSKKHNGTDPSFTTLLHQQIEAKLKAVNGFHSTEKNT
jgi:hypothetical protein